MPATTGRICYDWITAEDVLRHALACFYAECREADTYQLQPGDGLALHGRREFAQNLAEDISRRLLAALPQALPRYAFSSIRTGRDISFSKYKTIRRNADGAIPQFLGSYRRVPQSTVPLAGGGRPAGGASSAQPQPLWLSMPRAVSNTCASTAATWWPVCPACC